MRACGNFTSKYSLKICEEGGSKDISKMKTITYSLINNPQAITISSSILCFYV